MSKVFKPWTEEERRAHVRAKTLAFKGRQEARLTLREKQIKEELRQQREEVRKAHEEGAWIITGGAKKEKKEEKTKISTAKNMFAGLDSDEEAENEVIKEKEPEPVTWTKKKFDWGADSDEE